MIKETAAETLRDANSQVNLDGNGLNLKTSTNVLPHLLKNQTTSLPILGEPPRNQLLQWYRLKLHQLRGDPDALEVKLKLPDSPMQLKLTLPPSPRR